MYVFTCDCLVPWYNTSSQMNFKDINELFAYVTYIYDKLFTK